jgi:AcrR family transcriptional regulator
MATRQDPPDSAPAQRGGRDAQRRRTRQAIVDAAQRLLQEGRTPSVDDVADTAEVSRRTIYMYFPALDQLLLDAAVGLMTMDGVEAALDTMAADEDAPERVDALVRALLAHADDTLPLGRQIIRLTVGSPPEPGTATRGYRRVSWIEQALAPLRPRLTTEQFERLTSALALVVGWEAMTVLRDVRGLDATEEQAVLTWAARALVEAMLAESRDPQN